jgi:hypothetical protein
MPEALRLFLIVKNGHPYKVFEGEMKKRKAGSRVRSIGNEAGEQYGGTEGAALTRRLIE